MFVLGIGLGGVIQVLIIAVQSAVDYNDVGTATAGATFFRSMGGSFGTAVLGAICANVLAANLAKHLIGVRLPAGMTGASVSPQALVRLPVTAHSNRFSRGAKSAAASASAPANAPPRTPSPPAVGPRSAFGATPDATLTALAPR